MYSYFCPIFYSLPGISGRSKNTWREQKYRKEVGIYGLSRNIWKR
jgi:hypothetical protein